MGIPPGCHRGARVPTGVPLGCHICAMGVPPQECHGGATVEPLGSHRGCRLDNTGVPRMCHDRDATVVATGMPLWFYRGATEMPRGCHGGAKRVPWGATGVSKGMPKGYRLNDREGGLMKFTDS